MSETVTLPWDREKQAAVVGHLLDDAQFWRLLSPHVDVGWFSEHWLGELVRHMRIFQDRHGRPPTRLELTNAPHVLQMDAPSRAAIQNAMSSADLGRQRFGLDALGPELVDWARSHKLRVAWHEIKDLYNQKKWDEAVRRVGQVATDMQACTLDSAEESFDDYLQDVMESSRQYQDAVTTGLDLLDRLICPIAQRGALLPGDMTILLGPTNVGKSTICINILVANLLRGKRCLWIVREGRAQDLKDKLMAAVLTHLTGGQRVWSVGRIYQAVTQNLDRPVQMIRDAMRVVSERLVMRPWIRPGVRPNDVVQEVRRLQVAARMRWGQGFDLVVDDMPSILAVGDDAARNKPYRTIIDDAYRTLNHLAENERYHLVAPIQVNREGNKVNKAEDRLLVSTDVAEAFGPCQAAANILTANRSPSDVEAGRLVLLVEKSRSSETGWAVVCRTQYGSAVTHANWLGANYYRDGSNYAEQVSRLVISGRYPVGCEIPARILAEVAC